jgi:hypothetical protein
MVAAGWSEAQRRAYVLADNKLALNAGWDTDLLKLELADLQAEGFELGLTGFDGDELAALLADPTAGLTGPDDVPEPKAEAVSALGGTWPSLDAGGFGPAEFVLAEAFVVSAALLAVGLSFASAMRSSRVVPALSGPIASATALAPPDENSDDTLRMLVMLVPISNISAPRSMPAASAGPFSNDSMTNRRVPPLSVAKRRPKPALDPD